MIRVLAAGASLLTAPIMPRYSPHAVRFELAERLTERVEDALANEPFFDRQPDRAIRVNLDGRLVVLQLHFLGLEQNLK